jgi:hypothetical protein
METQNTTKTRPANPTPKHTFLEIPTWISDHRKLLDTPSFQRAIDYASRHYVRSLHGIAPSDLTHPNFMAASAMNFQRIQGMHDFIAVLMALSEVPPPRAAGKSSDNLDN